MIITEAALARLEKAGWVVASGLWTAEGHQVLLRRGNEEQVATVTSGPYLQGRTYGRVSLKTQQGATDRRLVALAELATHTARISYQGESREAFLQGVAAGMGPVKSTHSKRGGGK